MENGNSLPARILDRNFKYIYAILSRLEKVLDEPSFCGEEIKPDKIGISVTRWLTYMNMLQDAGYIDGFEYTIDLVDDINYDVTNVRVTLKGLEYLYNSSVMNAAFELLTKHKR